MAVPHDEQRSSTVSSHRWHTKALPDRCAEHKARTAVSVRSKSRETWSIMRSPLSHSSTSSP
jgi:hypothetical protein